MTHAEAMSHPLWRGERPDCQGELKELARLYRYDVYWVVYRCTECAAIVWTVEGQAHWWNHQYPGGG